MLLTGSIHLMVASDALAIMLQSNRARDTHTKHKVCKVNSGWLNERVRIAIAPIMVMLLS